MGIAEPAWLSREVSSAKGGLGSRRGGERQQIAAWLLGNCWKYQGFSQASRVMERKSLILEPGGTREVYYNLRDCGQLDGMGTSMKDGSKSTRTQWGHLFICLCLILSFPIKKKMVLILDFLLIKHKL